MTDTSDILAERFQIAESIDSMNDYSERSDYVEALSGGNPTIADGCGRLWDVMHMSIADMRSVTGLSQEAFGNASMIPRRTIQNWETGTRCPGIARVHVADCCNLLPIGGSRRSLEWRIDFAAATKNSNSAGEWLDWWRAPLADIRAARLLTQSDLAKLLLCRKRAVQRWESGDRHFPEYARLYLLESFSMIDF